MIKFLKLLRFNKRIGMLSKSLRYARARFEFIWLCIYDFYDCIRNYGFRCFRSITLQSYKSFFTSLTTCFRMLLGEINAPDMLGC